MKNIIGLWRTLNAMRLRQKMMSLTLRRQNGGKHVISEVIYRGTRYRVGGTQD